MTEEWSKVSSDVFKFENEGDVIEGILSAVEDSKKFDNKVYHIEVDDTQKTVFGTAILDSLMATVKVGDQIRIHYTGLKASKDKAKNPMKLFEVFKK